jgi:HPt (histidine-containing phosphotransfer) domain-containing protein
LDTQKGISMAGGDEAAYREILELYCQDVEERLPDLETMRNFVINVHGIKSASASIGADSLSEEARLLESAGKANDMEYIAKHLPGFRQSLSALAACIGAALRNE